MLYGDTQIEMISTRLERFTFASKKIRSWVETNANGFCLNLFAGNTLLDLNEVRNDVNVERNAQYNLDCVDFVESWEGDQFDTVILDPPYSLRKAKEKYDGKYCTRFSLLADKIDRIVKPGGKIISFGYHSTFMGAKRGYWLERMCVFAHGGAQHCTIAIIETKRR